MANVGEVMFGALGLEIDGAAQIIFFLFVMGSHILTFSIMMNTLTDHGACTIVFCLVGAILTFLLSLPRTLHNVSYLAIFWGSGTVVTSLLPAFSATLNIIIAFGEQVAFFSIQSELADPGKYPKALYTLETVDPILYLIAVVVYRFAVPP
ncbi:hypothetical protein EYZ11_009083 [Aspergillus tanneri]|uniref:Uncharacterized protein n=1 Tax=Aspergillus tanneri TaxID=1220188 RepID=A0A4S3J8S1_9EURO|nr:uncharacterized protein ATNIH1004_009752 [Aspergillus tanneri]KAA8642990.1 hypothetical protein ATNIH1004_009752 [Aspergillus tanneri]THC91453.1 hypothetical protein EYZ11_009083 [Aspergillus tanneri]